MKAQKKKARSAGFVIVRKGEVSWEVLGLRVWGRIDIPKGHLEEGESDFDAAVRETKEEAGIEIDKNRDMKWGNVHKILVRPHKDVCIFIAETEQEPFISKNPETNKFEHDDYHWMTWDMAKKHCYPYLIEVFDWAKSIVEGTV